MSYKNALLNLWFIFLILNLLGNMFFGDAASGLTIFSALITSKNVTKYLMWSTFWIIYLVKVKFWLHEVHPFFKKAWLGINVSLLPIQKRYFGLVFIFLLIFNLPSITYYEEYLFREGVTNWYDGLANSILFGFMHWVIGCCVATGIVQIFLGLWLTHCYLHPDSFILHGLIVKDGTFTSTVNHTTFDLIGCLVLLVCLVQNHLEDEKNGKEEKNQKVNTLDSRKIP